MNIYNIKFKLLKVSDELTLRRLFCKLWNVWIFLYEITKKFCDFLKFLFISSRICSYTQYIEIVCVIFLIIHYDLFMFNNLFLEINVFPKFTYLCVSLPEFSSTFTITKIRNFTKITFIIFLIETYKICLILITSFPENLMFSQSLHVSTGLFFNFLLHLFT